MKAPGLKIHISITIILLLTTTTLLASLVITVFWQQSLIRLEADRIRSILEISSQILQRDNFTRPDPLAFFSQTLETSSIDCLSVVNADNDGGKSILSASSTCPNQDQLSAVVKKSRISRSQVSETYGSTWGVFTLLPEYLIIAVSIGPDHNQKSIGAITSLKPVYQRVRQKQKTIITYLIVNILLIAVIGFFRLVKTTVKPVERLVRMTEEYDQTNEFLLLPDNEGGEFSQLSFALNRMVRRIDNDRKQLRDTVTSLEEANAQLRQTRDKMVRTEKLASIGRLSAGLAHEIGNPIGIIQGYLELLQREPLDDDDRLQFANRAAGELNRINQLIRQLLDFARPSPPGLQQIRINELLQDIFELFKARNKMDHIEFQLNLQTQDDLIETSEEGLRQVLLNCLINAVDAIEEKNEHRGEIVISSCDETDATLQPSIAITIRDNGCGIDTSRLTTIFDPFFTTKEPGKGTGLGLSVSHTIIESLGGQISVQSELGTGTEIKIILPRLGEDAS